MVVDATPIGEDADYTELHRVVFFDRLVGRFSDPGERRGLLWWHDVWLACFQAVELHIILPFKHGGQVAEGALVLACTFRAWRYISVYGCRSNAYSGF